MLALQDIVHHSFITQFYWVKKKKIKSFITHNVSKQMEKEIFKLFMKIKIFSIRRKKLLKVLLIFLSGS